MSPEVTGMRVISVAWWLGIVVAFLVWQGIGPSSRRVATQRARFRSAATTQRERVNMIGIDPIEGTGFVLHETVEDALVM
jgi:hypothetical protein